MGRFTCTHCKCSYYDKRFIWEPASVEEEGGSSAHTGSAFQLRNTTADESSAPASSVESRDNLDDCAIARAEDEDSVTSTSYGSLPSANSLDLTMSDIESSKEDHLPLVASSGSVVHSTEQTGMDSMKGMAVYADTIRAMGTTANVTATAASAVPVVCHICSPISAVGGLVGFSGGLSQLVRGVNTSSGVLDPHLVTKGGITTGVGGSCMLMGTMAFIQPLLFPAALGLGVVGLCAASAVDAGMDGLCPCCRQGNDSVGQEASAQGESKQKRLDDSPGRHPAGHYEPMELLVMKIFGRDL